MEKNDSLRRTIEKNIEGCREARVKAMGEKAYSWASHYQGRIEAYQEVLDLLDGELNGSLLS